MKQYINIDAVKTLMQEKNIDEKGLAELMNLKLSSAKSFLNGTDQSRLLGFTVYKLARALDTNIESLLNEEYRSSK